MKQKRKALFIVNNVAQSGMFEPIAQKLTGWDILFINETRWGNSIEIERVLQRVGFPFITIRRYSGSEVKQVIKHEQPDVVMIGNDANPMDRLFIEYANSLNIPTLLVQDGILAPGRAREISLVTPRLKFLLSLPWRLFRFVGSKRFSWQEKLENLQFELRYGDKGKRRNYGHGECLKMAVFGDAVRDMLVMEGVDPARIAVTGNPKFDRLCHCKDIDCKRKICQRRQITQENDILLLLTTSYVENGVWGLEQRRQFISAIIKAVTALPNIELVIKLHPSENESDYYAIVNGLDCAPIICRDVDLAELLNACSLVIAVSSTTALEAMSLQKPVVLVNLFNPGSSFYQDSGALQVSKEEDILPAIKEALYDTQARDRMRKAMEKFVSEQVYLQDGQASRRIAELVLSMTTRQS